MVDLARLVTKYSNESYTVDDLIEYAKGRPTIDLSLKELEHQYPHDRISKKRIDKVVIEGFPIIVKQDSDGDWFTLDGFHRAYKALKRGDTTIKAIVITDKDIAILNK